MSTQAVWFETTQGQTVFTLPFVPTLPISLYWNGLLQLPITYTVNNNQVTVNFSPEIVQVGDSICIYAEPVSAPTPAPSPTPPPAPILVPVVLPGSPGICLRINSRRFRADFPEFADTSIYSEGAFNYWSMVATLMLNAPRWGTILFLGTELFIAHNLVLETQAQQTALANGWPGENRGPINNESAGEVSVGYDTANAVEEGAGHWNLTIYGTRFINLVKMIGAGPIQVGPGCGGGDAGIVPGGQDGGPAWSGPNCLPGQSTFGG